MTDRVEQGEPEQLGVLLVALYLYHGNPVPQARAISPGAQQRAGLGVVADERGHLVAVLLQFGQYVRSDKPCCPGECHFHARKPPVSFGQLARVPPKSTVRAVPSQDGLFPECPQRHRAIWSGCRISRPSTTDPGWLLGG